MNLDDVNNKIITIRNQSVILDSDVAQLYGVQTMRINEAVKNNPEKFPEGYIISLDKEEWSNLISKISISSCEESLRSKNLILDNEDSLRSKISILDKQGRGQHKKYPPKAFTEKGLYMLATILKSPQAIQATIAIVETFAKLKQLSSNIAYLSSVDTEVIEPEIIESTVEKAGSLLNEIFFQGVPTSAETTVGFNFGFVKGNRTVRSEANPNIQTMQNEMNELKKTIAEMNDRLKKLTER